MELFLVNASLEPLKEESLNELLFWSMDWGLRLVLKVTI